MTELEHQLGGSENTLTLMGVSSGVASNNVLQPVILDGTESQDDLSCHATHHSAGDNGNISLWLRVSFNIFPFSLLIFPDSLFGSDITLYLTSYVTIIQPTRKSSEVP